ncbi:hypothetical protein [Calothrix sp. 336/3]|uniref:hypothetical protein n=1 Tax=Calothrix sp. 336/3 TaxID=1337936 RepID=UPI0004E2ECE7|nr:hypothetical protein [Calothrix sp. 336/3]AKG22495.1 hypothetical protein IJ00_15560 [Calothrix sp. 336/3]
MMQQSNALRRLEEILTEAIDNGDIQQASGPILLKAMNLGDQPHKILDFFELLNKAEEEAKSIKTKPKIDRYLQTIEKLHEYFIIHHVWSVQWNTFVTYIKDKGILTTLDSLAEFFYSENPEIFLEDDFLGKLKNEFNLISEKILQSDLSKELKRFLIEHIENLLNAIRRYQVDGTEGLKQAAQSLVSDLVMTEHSLKDVDKKNPIYTCVKAWGLSLLLYIAPSPYDIVGAVPDIYDFWVPRFEELSTGHTKIEKLICETPTIQEVFEKASDAFDRKPQKSLTGVKEVKALPASKED